MWICAYAILDVERAIPSAPLSEGFFRYSSDIWHFINSFIIFIVVIIIIIIIIIIIKMKVVSNTLRSELQSAVKV